MIPGAKFVVVHAGWISQVAIQLTGLYAEHAASQPGMAGPAIFAAWIVPLLSSRAARGSDGNRFEKVGAEQVRIGVIRPPFISHTIHGPLAVADYESRFK